MPFDKACVIAANNSKTADGQTLDYLALASIAAQRVKHYLDIPVYLLSNETIIHNDVMKEFNGVYKLNPGVVSKRTMVTDNDTIQYNWLNDSRIDVFTLTSKLANKILMIDADYLIASDQLKVWLDNDEPFQMFDRVVDLTGRGTYDRKYFPSNDIVQRWATAMCWDQSKEAKAIFETASMVRDNYEFYALMLGMQPSQFRNDLAFSVACHLHSVPTSSQTLFNLPADSEIVGQTANKFDWWYFKTNESLALWDNDIHILNKKFAIDPEAMKHLKLNHRDPAPVSE